MRFIFDALLYGIKNCGLQFHFFMALINKMDVRNEVLKRWEEFQCIFYFNNKAPMNRVTINCYYGNQDRYTKLISGK